MYKKSRKWLAWILSVVMLGSFLPMTSFAAGSYTVTLSSSATEVSNGESVEVSINVSSGTEKSYNAFFAVLSYDQAKFTYSGGKSVSGFDVDSETAGKLIISKTGADTAISEKPDLALTFTAKAGGTGAFSLDSAKVDVANNAAADAPEANRGDPLQVTVPTQLITEIRTEQDLIAFADSIAEGSDYTDITVTLQNDISLTKPWIPASIDYDHAFRGVFDGNQKTISGLSNSEETNLPLFGLFIYLKNASVKDLTVKGKVDGGEFLNGVAGIAVNVQDSTIVNCSSVVDINAKNAMAAGLVHSAKRTVIEKSANYAEISGNFAAGIANRIEFDGNTIRDCGNYGPVNGITKSAGIVNEAGAYLSDESWTQVSACVNKGAVSCSGSGECFASGIVNQSSYKKSGHVFITDCYNAGSVSAHSGATKRSGEAYSTGILSQSLGKTTIQNCYNVGSLTKTGKFDSTITRYGEITQSVYLSGNDFSGFQEMPVEADEYDVVNCYNSSEIKSLGGNAVNALGKEFTDGSGINAGATPALLWENETVEDDKEHEVIFQITGADEYTVRVADAEGNPIDAASKDTYALHAGNYTYEVTADGYLKSSGSFSIFTSTDRITIPVSLQKVVTVTFNVEPADAKLVVRKGSGVIEPGKEENGSFRFELESGQTYSYTVTADGYNGTTRDLTAVEDRTIEVKLTKSAQGQVDASRVIKPDNVPYTISEGGMYELMPGDFGEKGYVYLDTTEPVTIIGSGTALSSQSQDLFIVSRREGVNLTLQDVYISNELGRTNMVDFQGKGNTLNFSGTSILDQNTGASGYAMIHVPDSAELTVTGGTLYMYKREQGAGIGGNGGATGGGQTAETNGNITIKDATIFAKNSKQGALIGAGAQAGAQKPGSITIEDSTLYLIAISRSAAIGGSAGGTGASSGSTVTTSNSQITINVDFSGAAIGGGGYAEGNDADGGTLVYDGGSIRTYIDTNAIEEGLWKGIDEPGVNGNAAITAKVVNPDGKPLYLLTLDTEKIGDSDYTVKEGNQTVYSGGLHSYSYINESLPKEFQVAIDYTIDNWVDLDDPNLYLYLTGEDHTLDVNGQKVKAVWNEETKSFTVTVEGTVDPPEAADKSLLEEALKAAQDAQKDVMISEDGSDVDPADQWVPQSAADALKEAIDAAQAVKDNPDANQDEVDAAADALKRAQKTFDETKKDGTKADDHDASCPSKAFSDLDTSKWYHEAIDYVLLKNYFNGVGNGKFEPAGTMTRAMFVTVLGRAAGVEEDKNAHSSFSDVADGKWYTTYVDWAAQNDIVNGYDSKTFGPDDFITREQMAAILYRYARYKGVDVKAADDAKYHTFRDADQVSNYAKVPMIWAVDKGIINGMGDGILAPQETATRSQVAQLIMNFDKLIG